MDNHEKKIEFEKNVTYEIGDKKAVVVRNFRENDNKQTVSTILSRLIQSDIEAEIA